MFRCPHCNAVITAGSSLPSFSVRENAVYSAVARAGSEGIQIEHLVIEMYVGTRKKPTPAGEGVLRTMVNTINKKIEPFGQRIRSKRGWGYRLTRLEQFDGKTQTGSEEDRQVAR